MQPISMKMQTFLSDWNNKIAGAKEKTRDITYMGMSLFSVKLLNYINL